MAGDVTTVEVRARLRPGPPELAALVGAVDDGARPDRLRALLATAEPALREYGVADPLIDAIHSGLTGGGWDDAVAAFAATRADPVVFYLGPLRAREGDPASIGLVLGRRDPVASGGFTVVEASVADIGRQLFGFPASYRGRVVEFFHLDAVAGGAVGPAEAPIALFTPFYLDGWTDRDRQAGGARTILWSSVVVDRFRAIAGALAGEALRIDDAPPTVLGATTESLQACVGLWLSLHELFHSSGPLPLFEPASAKSSIARYGVVEESRVDMSTFLTLARMGDAGSLPRQAAELVVLERLLRSARCGAAEQGTQGRPGLDGQHGLVWAGLLDRHGALRRATGATPAMLHFGQTVEVVSAHLREIYETESTTVDAPDGRSDELRALAARTHAAWLDAAPPGLTTVAAWTDRAPVRAVLRAGPRPDEAADR